MRMVWDASRGCFDIALTKSGGVDASDPLSGAVIVSLFTDRTADPSEMTPDLGTDRRGWWADASKPVERRMGSLLWTEYRQKKSDAVRRRIESKAKAALAWLVEDGAAASVDVVASFPRDRPEWIALQVVVVEPSGIRRDWKLDVLWAAYRN